MRVLSLKTLRDFWQKHPDAESPLRQWFQVACASEWHDFAGVRAIYHHADQVDQFTVFTVGGNKYRLITVINFTGGVVYVRAALSHAEYDREQWKKDTFGGRGEWLPRHRESVRGSPAGPPKRKGKHGSTGREA